MEKQANKDDGSSPEWLYAFRRVNGSSVVVYLEHRDPLFVLDVVELGERATARLDAENPARQ